MTEGWTILILDRVDARPDLIIIKTSLEAVSNYGSCHRTTFLSLPTPPPGHGGVGFSLGQLHEMLLLRGPSRSMGGSLLLQRKDMVRSCNQESQLKGYLGGKCSGFPKAGLKGCRVHFQSTVQGFSHVTH